MRWETLLTFGNKFEHGTISYLLTSTLTRPTTISPTLTIHHKLSVTGTVDIAHLPPPKPRVVSLEAVSKKAKGRMQVRRKSTGLMNGIVSTCPSLEGKPVTRVSSPSPQASDLPPQSPVPSIVSSASTGESTTSASNHFRAIHSTEADGSIENINSLPPAEKSITAKTELLQGGCLPGDTLQIRISIDHVKPVKAMQGLIITVFRQGRIDTHPALPIGPTEDGVRRQYEDYYPRSRTGLGGLSLSSAGSSRVFRQDLAQTITPLIIDPQSLNANIKTSIQMPDHAFPTITCVPGGMISFKYYVETVVDLRGKLPGQDRFLPSLSITNAPQHSYGEPKISKIEGIDGVSYSASPGFNYLVTDQIRRTKGVIFTTTEVIVGTRDSTRSRLKQRENSDGSNQSGALEVSSNTGNQRAPSIPDTTPPAQVPLQEHQPDWQNPPEGTRDSGQAPLFLPPPPDIDEPQDEKSQIRRAEERLLPSSPPQDEESPAAALTPAAPFAHDEEDLVNRYGFGALAPAYEGPWASSRNTDTLPPPFQSPHDTAATSSDRPPESSDDKQELESKRLQALRSAPGDDEHTGMQVGPPTTPALHEGSSSATMPSPHSPQATLEDQQAIDHQQLLAQTSVRDESPEADHNSPSPIHQQNLSLEPSAPTLDEVELVHTNDDHDNENLPVYRR